MSGVLHVLVAHCLCTASAGVAVAGEVVLLPLGGLRFDSGNYSSVKDASHAARLDLGKQGLGSPQEHFMKDSRWFGGTRLSLRQPRRVGRALLALAVRGARSAEVATKITHSSTASCLPCRRARPRPARRGHPRGSPRGASTWPPPWSVPSPTPAPRRWHQDAHNHPPSVGVLHLDRLARSPDGLCPTATRPLAWGCRACSQAPYNLLRPERIPRNVLWQGTAHSLPQP
jgi:hypothetical protein